MNAPPEGVPIRPMTEADLARAMAIAASLPDAPQWPESAYRAALNPESTPRRIALVAADSQAGDVLGLAVASLLPPQAELETIAVASGSQRRGLGRSSSTSWPLSSGRRKSSNSTWKCGRRTIRHSRSTALSALLKRLRRGYYADPVDDAVLMRLNLG